MMKDQRRITKVKLDQVIKDFDYITLKGTTNREIKGIAYNSNLVKEDYIFVAIEGFKVDGHQYIDQAISNGAKVIILSKDIEVSQDVTIVKTKSTRESLSQLSAAFFGKPSENIELIGITGTNGKTTTSYF